MPASLVSNPFATLPHAANTMWERAYKRHLKHGESKKAAAIHAWMHVKKFYQQDKRTGRWYHR